MESEREILASESDTSIQSMQSASSGCDGRKTRSAKRKRHEDVQSSSDASLTQEEFKSPVFDPTVINRRKEFLARKSRVDAESELEELTQKACVSRKKLREQLTADIDSRNAEALNNQVAADLAIVKKVVQRSKNLKGTFQRALNQSIASIEAAVRVLHERTASDEATKLRADNERLQKEVADLRREMAEIRDEIRERQVSTALSLSPSQQMMEVNDSPVTKSGENTVEELTRSIMIQVGGMINARLEALENRLLPEKRLRPPLAADKRNAEASSVSSQLSKPVPDLSKKRTPATRKVKKVRKKKGVEKTTPVVEVPCPRPSTSKATDQPWSTVVGRKGKTVVLQSALATAVPALANKPKKQTGQVKLRPPRSAAVVITLQPGAEEKGVTYAKILAEARQKVDIAGCGITGLRCRKAATGARILEVSGATSGEKADSLAAKLREALDVDLARVSRPSKSAEMRISGLDDSVSSAEVIAAVAQRGGCSIDAIKAGHLKPDFQGTSCIWVRCPIAAAKKLGQEGKLLVGWVAARVALLQPRPQRCYRCLQNGHVHAQCTEEADRSDECYRCGQKGHKAADCDASAAKCTVCAAANRPSAHMLGSKACLPPKPKPKRGAKVVIPTIALTPAVQGSPPTQIGEEEVMIFSQD